MKYTLTDLRQASTGAFLAVVVFFAIRGDNPLSFNPTYGMIISALLVYAYYDSFIGSRDKQLHFVINILVAFGISAIMGSVFKIASLDVINFELVFGSLVTVGTWIAIPSALIFDKFNFVNPLRKYFVRGRSIK